MQPIKTLLKEHRSAILIASLFAVVYSLISFVNHYNYRTNWFDLGLYTNHLYLYSHLDFINVRSALADHFDLLLLLFSPLIYLFGTYTLLAVQIVFILIGGFGIYTLCGDILKSRKLGLLAQFTFYFSFGVLPSVAFDYHSNVVAACLVPFLFSFYRNNNAKGFFAMFLLILISKENMILWLAFILSGLPFIFRTNTGLKRTSLILSVFTLLIFVLISSVIMPYLAGSDHYPNFKYASVGNSRSFKDVFVYILQHPWDTVQLMFTNTSGNALYDHYKTEAHIYILLSGGVLFLFRPVYLWMLLPVYLQKFLHDSESMWGLAYQYNIEFVPVIILMIADIASRCNSEKYRFRFILAVLIINAVLSIRLMDRTVCFIKHSAIRIYQSMHYESDYNVKQVQFLISKIPDDASVSAQSVFTPHLALRKDLKMYRGANENADYILVADSYEPYPLKKEEFEKQFSILMRNPEYKLFLAFEKLYLFEKISKTKKSP